MAEAFAKFSVGTPGSGAAHASYITRSSALEPDVNRNQGTQLELNMGETSVRAALDSDLSIGPLDRGVGDGKADPVWTWNAPSSLTGDDYGIQQGSSGSLNGPIAGNDRPSYNATPHGISSPDRTKRLHEKSTRLRTYFGNKERFEKAKGGRTHYRLILSFDVPATNEQIRDLTNNFLRDTFPKAIGFAAIHRDTEHPHVHVYLHARQVDGKKIYLSRDAYRTIDENWAKIYSHFAGDRSIYVQHLFKKEETRQWKIAAADAYRKGEPIPPKPERDNDRRERLSEQRLSAQRSQARDQGKQIGPRPPAAPIMRAGSEKETGRLLAKAQLAREQLTHLIRIEAPQGQIRSVATIAYELTATVDRTITARKSAGKERLPAVVYTTEECKQLKEYNASRNVPVNQEHAAARLYAARVLAAAELTDVEGKAQSFRATRHFWKFQVEGWDRKLSLKEVEQEIKKKTEEKFKLYNLLRPSKRESIQGQLDYLNDVKSDLQKQLVAKGVAIEKTLGAAGIKYDVASKQVEQAQQTRSRMGKGMPLPVFQNDELAKMTEIGARNKEARLLAYAYSQVREKVLANLTPEALSRVKGHAVIARMEMLREAERLKAAIEYGEFRQVPLRDARGLDYTKSLREVEPRNALEAFIRHFTDSAGQKQEKQELSDAAREQLHTAEAQSLKARDYSVVLDNIAADHFKAAGVHPGQIAPELDEKQIAALREFAERQPLLSGARKEFTEAAKQAEQLVQDREAAAAVREFRPHDQVTRPVEQSRSEVTTSDHRTSRDSFSRGR